MLLGQILYTSVLSAHTTDSYTHLQSAATQHSKASTPHATPAAVLMAQGREEKKIPVMKMSGLVVSIKRPHIEEEQRNPSSNPTACLLYTSYRNRSFTVGYLFLFRPRVLQL